MLFFEVSKSTRDILKSWGDLQITPTYTEQLLFEKEYYCFLILFLKSEGDSPVIFRNAV
jgi:hypothetical protein